MFFLRSTSPASSAAAKPKPQPASPPPASKPAAEAPPLEPYNPANPGPEEGDEVEEEVCPAMAHTAGLLLVDEQGCALTSVAGTAIFPDGTCKRFVTGCDGRFFIGGLAEGGTFDIELDEIPTRGGSNVVKDEDDDPPATDPSSEEDEPLVCEEEEPPVCEEEEEPQVCEEEEEEPLADGMIYDLSDVPWVYQIDKTKLGPNASWTYCYYACEWMCKQVGTHPKGPRVSRIQIAASENTNGEITVIPGAVEEAKTYIDGQLSVKKPVIVGVSARDEAYNVDKITDHFVTITGKRIKNGKVQYRYHDPGTKSGVSNWFDIEPSTGNIWKDGKHFVKGKTYMHECHYQVSMVVKNA